LSIATAPTVSTLSTWGCARRSIRPRPEPTVCS
jgi:hypothetical protein